MIFNALDEKLFVSYALQFVGIQYRWGGDDPLAGYDCSGFAQELLAAFGADPPGDQTAHALQEWCKKNKFIPKKGPGCLAFYGKPDRVTHVGVMLSEEIMIEAGGGGSRTTSTAAAIQQNAYIRLRPLNRRRDLVALYNPFYKNLPLS